ncbi:hypothetical protein [Pseudomonas mosselii]|uniref:hypothetical protein n=1 Tax=Pseudomonas mosselii TaxID=78327 RepID=UPI0027DBA1BA|nr:hypothetical protein [Pseudomonas mosselii]
MAKFSVRKSSETFLSLESPEEGLYEINHIYEPDFHQEEYVSICNSLAANRASYQLANCKELVGTIHRGAQPKYADNEIDPESLYWQGMTDSQGRTVVDSSANICALKSVCVRAGYIDLETARSVSKQDYLRTKNRAGVQKHDVLINSTGDGTIGRVAVYDHDFPAVVDGHITILRFSDVDLAWYVAAYLMSDDGQKQIFRYINGSSGQVEIYPQDIGRIWIKPASDEKIKDVSVRFRLACESYKQFKQDIKRALSLV